MQRPKSLAGTLLRFVALRSVASPLAHVYTLDREQGALLRCESLRRSSIARSSFAPLLFARSFFARSSYAPSLFARRLPALYLATNRSYTHIKGEALNPSADEESGKVLAPTRPPLAPVRSRPYAEAPGRDRPDSSLPPAPPAGGEITLQTQAQKQHPSSLAGTLFRFVALRSIASPLPHYRPLARLGPAPFFATLR